MPGARLASMGAALDKNLYTTASMDSQRRSNEDSYREKTDRLHAALVDTAEGVQGRETFKRTFGYDPELAWSSRSLQTRLLIDMALIWCNNEAATDRITKVFIDNIKESPKGRDQRGRSPAKPDTSHAAIDSRPQALQQTDRRLAGNVS
jgi:hypothetical protein